MKTGSISNAFALAQTKKVLFFRCNAARVLLFRGFRCRRFTGKMAELTDSSISITMYDGVSL